MGMGGATIYALVKTFRVPLRVLGVLFPPLEQLSPFYFSFLRLGGVERIYVLLTLARFDSNNTGEIDEQQRQLKGGALVADAAITCSSMSVVSSLIIGLTHLQAIGRPVAWMASEDFLAEYGEDAAERLLYVAQAFNAMTEALAIAMLMLCVPFRVLLTSVLPSLDAKIMVLCESNLSNMMMSIFNVIAALFCAVLGLGGILQHPQTGFFACGCALLVMVIMHFAVTPYFFHAALQLHIEAKELLSRYPNPVKKEPRAGTMDGISKITNLFVRALTKQNIVGGAGESPSSFTRRMRCPAAPSGETSGDKRRSSDSTRRRSSGLSAGRRSIVASLRNRGGGSGRDGGGGGGGGGGTLFPGAHASKVSGALEERSHGEYLGKVAAYS